MARRMAKAKQKRDPAEKFWLKDSSDDWSSALLRVMNLYEIARINAIADLEPDSSDVLILARRLRATALCDKEIHLPSLERLSLWVSGKHHRKEIL
jgi:hypothetical protein